jgi:hypothetical protein
MTLLTRYDLAGNMDAIMLKQQEEFFLPALLLSIAFVCFIHWWIILLWLPYPLIILISGLKKFCKTVSMRDKHMFPFMFAWFMQENPFFAEAYANCNYPQYLEKRTIFAWLRYVK